MKKVIYLFCLVLCTVACDDITEVEDISNEKVTVLAPANDVTLTDATVVFTWDAVEEAEHYKIQIATPSFEAAMQIVTDSTVTTTSFNKALSSGDYEWRVSAENSGYNTVYTAQKFKLVTSIVDISKELVVITSPSNNATFSTTDTISFSWSTINNATEYIIQIATPDFENPTETIKDETISSTSFSVSNLSKNEYKCRVKAKNASFETVYTETAFTVD